MQKRPLAQFAQESTSNVLRLLQRGLEESQGSLETVVASEAVFQVRLALHWELEKLLGTRAAAPTTEEILAG